MQQQFVLLSLLLLAATLSTSYAQKGRSFVNNAKSPARKAQGIKFPVARPKISQTHIDQDSSLAGTLRRPPTSSAVAAPVAQRPAAPAPSFPRPVPARIAPAPASAPSFPRPVPARIAPAPASAPTFPRPVPARIAPAPAPAPAPARISPAPAPAPARSAVAAPVRIPAPSYDEGEEGPHPAPEPYSFSFAVNDEESGAQLTREERQDAGGNVVGFYYILDAEGRRRRVDYTAGPEGFKATVSSNEEGLSNSANAADTSFDVEEAPVERQEAAAAAARAAARSRAA